jgi:hypothetical protein
MALHPDGQVFPTPEAIASPAKLMKVQEQIIRLEKEIHDAGKSVAETLSPDKYIQLLDALPPDAKYNRIPDGVAADCRRILQDHGVQTLEPLHKVVLARLVCQFETRANGKKFPPLVIELFRREHARILAELSTNAPGFYSLSNDLFLKDLGLARTLLIPAGVEFVQLAAGVPRSVTWKGGFRQFASAIPFFIGRLRGFGPFFEIHMDPRRRKELSPETRSYCYHIVAELLKIHNNVKGLLGGSWFYDPALETITPRLSYLSRVPVQHGAMIFYSADEDESSGALTYSTSRRRLFEQGRYRPRTYLLVWPRADLLRWAAQDNAAFLSQ